MSLKIKPFNINLILWNYWRCLFNINREQAKTWDTINFEKIQMFKLPNRRKKILQKHGLQLSRKNKLQISFFDFPWGINWERSHHLSWTPFGEPSTGKEVIIWHMLKPIHFKYGHEASTTNKPYFMTSMKL